MSQKINFMVACVPNWVDQDATILTPGGEMLPGTPAINVKTTLMGQFWRTPTLKPRHTQLTANFSDPTKRLSQGILLGALNLPEAGTLLRVRKGAVVTDEWLRPRYFTDTTTTNAFLASTNATSNGPSDLNDDPYNPNGSWVTPTVQANPLDFRVSLHLLLNPLATGPYKQSVQVAYSFMVSGISGPTIRLELWQAGVYTGLSITEQCFPAGETGSWVVELKFDAAALTDPTGANLEVRCVTAPANGEAVKVGAMRLLATVQYQIARPALAAALVSSANAASTAVANITAADTWDPNNEPVGIGPTVGATPLQLLVGFAASPGTLNTTALYQRFAVAYKATGGAACTITLTLYINGVATGVTATVTAAGGAATQWATLKWSASDLGGSSPSLAQVKIVTAPTGGQSITVLSVQWQASLAIAPCDYDTGWVNAFYTNPSSAWGIYVPDLVGKVVQKSIPILFLDVNGNSVALTSQYTRIEFLVSTAGVWSFTDPGSGYTVTWMDMGRYAEGPALNGMNMGSGFVVGVVDLSTRDVSDGGVSWEDEEACYRTIQLKLNELKQVTAISDVFDLLVRRMGISRDMLLVIFPETDSFRRLIFAWGPFDSAAKVTHDHGVTFKADMTVRERL